MQVSRVSRRAALQRRIPITRFPWAKIDIRVFIKCGDATHRVVLSNPELVGMRNILA